MNIYVTGPQGLIARNLKVVLEGRGHKVFGDRDLFEWVDEPDVWPYPKDSRVHCFYGGGDKEEVCVYSTPEHVWTDAFKRSRIDVVIHNAAVVGTDVVALDPEKAVLSNVQGTYNVVRAAKAADVRVCYLGTTVIYDTYLYQDVAIQENDVKRPRTYYGVQKLAGEQIVTSIAREDEWTIVRPLFAYGGLGDMNSLIAKSIYGALSNRESVDIFLDPGRVKDYLHVVDFCGAVATVIESYDGWGTDWNVAAETPIPAGEVLDVVESVLPGTASRVKWHPQTDYLGNHRLSARKIREELGWTPSIDLESGIRSTLDWIRGSTGYNPLRFIDVARDTSSDLLDHFPKAAK